MDRRITARRRRLRQQGLAHKREVTIVRHDLPVVKEAMEKILPPLDELEKELAESAT